METHAHHLHKAPGKNFLHYFFEFFMLFLAVFCGFLVENFREGRVEKNRAKEYMKEIVENLKYDIIRCDKNIGRNIEITKGLDSLRAELKNTIAGADNSNALYYFTFQYAGKFNQAVFNHSAITELKNSGNLRLIENKKIVIELADYYERKVYATNDDLPTEAQRDVLQKAGNGLFNLLYLDDYIASYDDIRETTYNNNYNYQNMLNHNPALQLLTDNSKELENYYTLISQFEMKLKNYNFWLRLDKSTAEKLIEDIQKEYHLE